MRLWDRRCEPWDVERLGAEERAALEKTARHRVEADSFGELRAGVRVEGKRIGRRGFFEWISGVPREQITHYLIFDRFLVQVGTEAKLGAFALASRLDRIEVRGRGHDLYDDPGVHLFGEIGGGTERGSVFVGLGEGPHAEAFERALREAIEAANA